MRTEVRPGLIGPRLRLASPVEGLLRHGVTDAISVVRIVEIGFGEFEFADGGEDQAVVVAPLRRKRGRSQAVKGAIPASRRGGARQQAGHQGQAGNRDHQRPQAAQE